MIYSMTGFGRGEAEDALSKFTIEIKSVNHKYNDIIVRMPKKLTMFEDRIKQAVKKKINRGRVEIYISLEESKSDDFVILPNHNVLKQYHSALTQIKETYNIDEPLSLSLMAKYPDALIVEMKEADEDEIWNLISNALETGLESLMEMRMTEGEKLHQDIAERLATVGNTVKCIEAMAPEIIEAYRVKMMERMREILDEVIEVDESRILHEVAVYADKSNVTEEIVRLNSHLDQLIKIFNQNGPVGRKLDFLVQEMNREINTIGSKSPDVDISNHVVDLKSEIEKIREQIQNIE